MITPHRAKKKRQYTVFLPPMFDTRIKLACFACASQRFNARLLSTRYMLWKLADLTVGALFFSTKRQSNTGKNHNFRKFQEYTTGTTFEPNIILKHPAVDCYVCCIFFSLLLVYLVVWCYCHRVCCCVLFNLFCVAFVQPFFKLYYTNAK